jgi:hypothetical protein
MRARAVALHVLGLLPLSIGETGGVRGDGLPRDPCPLTPTLSPQGRGGPPSSWQSPCVNSGGKSYGCRGLAFGVLLAFAHMAQAGAQELPQLHTNQQYLEEAGRSASLDIGDPMAVFAFVLASLPDRVKVYPTENYYYFSFLHKGVPYAGNIRLDASDRDAGKVNFGYYEDYAPWHGEAPISYRLLDAAAGVTVEKVERLVYRIAYGGKSVIFELNDLSQVKPPPTAMAPEEKFIGPVFDESGMRFFLVFNPRLKIFHYVLDETAPVADAFFPARRTDRIVIGKRTGFAFYRDQRRERKILIGVFWGNSRVNNYFDGPFDQLPDNFIEGEILRDALIQVDPKLKGQIDRFGAWPGGEQRYMIAPYLIYDKESDLAFFDDCTTSRYTPQDKYYSCFALDPAVTNGGEPAEPPRRSRQGRKGR